MKIINCTVNVALFLNMHAINTFLIKYGEIVISIIKKIIEIFFIDILKNKYKYKKLKNIIIINSPLRRINKPAVNENKPIKKIFLFCISLKKKIEEQN